MATPPLVDEAGELLAAAAAQRPAAYGVASPLDNLSFKPPAQDHFHSEPGSQRFLQQARQFADDAGKSARRRRR